MERNHGGDALSCRRHEDIDWSAFLREPGDGAFDAFRAHYPGCVECAAAVRAWTALIDGLGASAEAPTHPTPEELECFERAPAELAPGRSDFVAAHLRSCPSCSEELQALRGHDPDRFRAAPAAGPRPGDRLRRILWNPAFALVLVGFLLFPLLYRSLGPAPSESAARSQAESSQEGALLDRPSAPPSSLTQRSERLEEADKLADADRGVRARARAPAEPQIVASARPAAKMSRAVVPESEPKPDTDLEPARDGLAANLSHEAAAPSGAPDPAAAVLGAPAPLASEDAAEVGQRPTETASSVTPEAAPARKSEDPLAHHVWIPTMRLRPGQKSWGPAEELRNGFFLEIPLPREAPAGEARILILPDGPGRSEASKRAPVPLAAERRALEALSKRDNAATERPPSGFEERVAVEANQRAVLLQVPPAVLATGVYRVDLELHSKGAVRGRARFRLELVDE